MAKLEIPIIVNCTEIDELIDEIKHLQTYKLFEGDEQVLIDRDDTIEIFAKHIRASAQPEQRWIPCKERLPEERDWYLGIFQESDTGWINPIPFVCDYVGHETRATTKEYWILHGFTDEEPVNPYYFNLKCIAWMPLPEPYKPYKEESGEQSI